jgi:amino acid transporter
MGGRMTRIFTTLAVLNALALVAGFVTGVVSKLGDGVHHPQIFLAHFTTGLFTAIGTLFVHCLIFTYFLGTGRWVKEVGLAYDLPDASLPRRTRELKRGTFPTALVAMLITIATAAAGMGAQRQEWPWQVHGSLAVVTLLVNAWAFSIEYRNVRANGLIIEEVMREVDRIRRQRGLPSNAEELERHAV